MTSFNQLIASQTNLNPAFAKAFASATVNEVATAETAGRVDEMTGHRKGLEKLLNALEDPTQPDESYSPGDDALMSDK